MNDPILIDECLTPELASIAHDLGLEAHHVAYIGLTSKTDRAIFERVEERGFVFVTNNREDWHKLVSKADLHAGLIVILPNCRGAQQKVLFRAALEHAIAIGGLTNKVLEIDAGGAIGVYNLPGPSAALQGGAVA